MSINSINGVNGYNYGMNQADSIKPETRQKLKELDINDTSIRTESQAQKKIEEKGKEIKKQIQERLQAEASQNVQQPQAFTQQAQPVQGVQQPEQVDGVKQSQQVKQPEGIEQQYGVQNQQTGNEQSKAFAGSNAAQQQQVQPFALGNDIVAMYNKFKLGLI